jgi:hypothetical protein
LEWGEATRNRRRTHGEPRGSPWREDVCEGNGDIREGERGGSAVGGNGELFAAGVAFGLAVDFPHVGFEVQQPEFANAGGGMGGALFLAVLGQRSVGDLDDEKEFLGRGVPPGGAAAHRDKRKVRLGIEYRSNTTGFRGEIM